MWFAELEAMLTIVTAVILAPDGKTEANALLLIFRVLPRCSLEGSAEYRPWEWPQHDPWQCPQWAHHQHQYPRCQPLPATGQEWRWEHVAAATRDSLLLIVAFFIFLLFTTSVVTVIFQFKLFSSQWADCHHLSCLLFFTPFSLCYFFLICLCLSIFCVAGIGLGSSPTSSQIEALPPSTDWPVSAYTSSFSLSSPEMDDAGTWSNCKPHLPHCSGSIAANPLPPVTVKPRASSPSIQCSWLNMTLIQDFSPWTLPLVHISPHGVSVSPSSLCVAWEVWNTV